MFPSIHFSIPHCHFQEKGSEQDMRFILPNTEECPYPQDLNHANVFTTAASRLSVSDLPQLLLISRKLPQTKTTPTAPAIVPLPPIHHDSNPKGFFTSPSSLPQFFVSATSSVPPTHLESGEQTNLASSNNNKKKKRKGGKKVVFWPGRLLCIFIWKEQANLFSFHHEPKGMAIDPKASHSHKSALTKKWAGISSGHTGTSE